MIELNEEIWQHIYLLLTSFFFGLGQWSMKVRKQEIRLSRFDLLSEILFAQLAGFITYKICLYFNFNFNLTWVLVSINSWSGSKFLDKFQNMSASFIANKFGIDAKELDNERVNLEYQGEHKRVRNRRRLNSSTDESENSGNMVRPHSKEMEQ